MSGSIWECVYWIVFECFCVLCLSAWLWKACGGANVLPDPADTQLSARNEKMLINPVFAALRLRFHAVVKIQLQNNLLMCECNRLLIKLHVKFTHLCRVT